MLTKVDMAKEAPKKANPSTNITTLKIATKVETGTPNWWYMKSPSPVVPPVISPFGKINITTPSA